MSFDVIGDVHGHAAALVELLTTMGYAEVDGAWRHDTRQAVFVGDLIDRGPAQVECYRIVRAMAEAGSAQVVAGNHEFNAVAFHTPDPERPGEYLRPRSPGNLRQHGDFLDQVGEGSPLHDEIVAWFSTLPLWLDLNGLRVVHACWDDASIAVVGGRLSPALVEAASRPGGAEYEAIEVLLKGPETPIAEPYRDKDGKLRHHARVAWWEAGTFRPPVVYGHYWRTGTPTRSSPGTACVDYSVARGGPLVAYRWSGEAVLTDEHFVSTGTR